MNDRGEKIEDVEVDENDHIISCTKIPNLRFHRYT